MSSAVIQVRGLTKVYPGQRNRPPVLAVDHIDFDVQEGEIFGFLGPNGAGKTTTHRMLTTLLTPTEGQVLIAGHDIERDAYMAKRQMGLVTEEANVYRDMSAWDNLMFAGRLYRMSKAEREARAAELLKLFGLWEARHEKTEGYSRGMRRRLSIAMAIIHRPKLLFLDEPTPGLDAQSARAIRDLVREMKARGTTIFLTTHQIEEANLLCDRVAIINHGRIAAIDTPERLKRDFQEVQSVQVALEPDAQRHGELLAALGGVSQVVKRGDKWQLYTADPSALVLKVVDYARRHGLTIVSLNTLGPSLEDVFLRITGQEIGVVRLPDTANRSKKRRRS